MGRESGYSPYSCGWWVADVVSPAAELGSPHDRQTAVFTPQLRMVGC